MIELAGEIPFLWRLSPETSDGYCSVSVVVTAPPEAEVKDVTIETSVLSLSSDTTRSTNEETLEWNQEDISLFLRLVNSNNKPLADTVKIDLRDPEIIEIIHVVAAAGFGVAFTSYGLLKTADGTLPIQKCEIGLLASLNTHSGFKSCVIVDVEDDDVVCVLLDNIEVTLDGDADRVYRHDLLLVKRVDLVRPEFAENRKKPTTAILH